MKYRFHKGLKVSAIGIGCYSLSGVYGKKDPDEFQQMIRIAHKSGVNFYDTAGSYGELAEEVLGNAVFPFRKEVFISTKVGVQDDGNFDLTERGIKSAVERSLKRLKTDWIDLLQVHFDDPKTPVSETIAVLEGLKREGKIIQYGVGHLPISRVKHYLELGQPFSLMFELSPVSRSARTRYFPLLETKNLKGIAFSTTGRGMLSLKSIPENFPPGDLRNIDPLFHFDLRRSGLRVREKMEEIARENGKTLAQVSLAWVLSHPQILCALTGPSTVSHLAENLEASEWDFPRENLEELEILFNKEDARLTRERLETASGILGGSIKGKDETSDLIYALDTLMELEMVPEKDALPYFLKILGMEKLSPEKKSGLAREIKEEIRQFLPAS
ncbi:MAG: aldo/keto reductase [Caldiserica bacterium]|jgi:aryl-alcohol dehydrogenase-like predicted oxidoreductase|nr:aldo/keto reductase [Caldisericota bacterium]MDH7562619.1 aldo/keto reductase [Caldisericota bacterium]